jgi:eukaryotic-like serine/threonine-protein kinase
VTSDKGLDSDRLDALAEDFVARYREGDCPSISDYTAQHPDLADEIRDLFPALAMMEDARPPASEIQRIAPAGRQPVLERLGEYRILREVGRGGMGIVYEAEQESLGRHVALKVLPTHVLLEPRHLQRFQREARAAARLHHTNIVPVFGVGDHDGLNYYVMQFIQGLGLDEVLVELKRLRHNRRRKEQSTSGSCAVVSLGKDFAAEQIAEGLLSGQFRVTPGDAPGPATTGPEKSQTDINMLLCEPQDHRNSDVQLPGQDKGSSLSDGGREYWFGVARVGIQVAEALAYANSQGVLHRDIKPSNLLLDVKGIVWVTDFGLAKEFDPHGSASDRDDPGKSLTRTGDVVGTLRYLAPERLRGESDQRSDIYSLGATLYELLTLRPAFEESDRSVLIRRVLHQEPVRPRVHDRAIPPDLETIVAKAMAKEPADRYQDAAELAEDLRCFLNDRPIHARRATAVERLWRFTRRNPTITGLSVTVVLLAATLAASMVVAGWIRTERDHAVQNLTRAERAEQDSNRNLERAQQAEQDATIRTHLTQAIVHRKRARTGHRSRSLSEIDRALSLDPSTEMRDALRKELIASLAHDDLSPTRSWECPRAALDVDPAFQRYARGTRDGAISIRRIVDNQEVWRFQRPPPPDARFVLRFSPDGKYLASFTFDHHLIVWEIEQGQEILNDTGCAWDSAFDFTADSRSIVSGHAKEIVIYDLETSDIKARWTTEFTPWCVSCGPDGERVAISPEDSDRPHRLHVVSCSTGKVVAKLAATDWIFDIAWHPHRESIAFSSGDTQIYLWDIGELRPHRTWSTDGSRGISIEFSHDGGLLASCDWGNMLSVWDVPTSQLLCRAKLEIACIRFSPDDRELGCFRDSPNVGIYRLIRSSIFRYVLRDDRREGESLRNGAFSPDGRLLAVATLTGLGFWDFATGKELAFAPIGRVPYLHFEDSGDLLSSANGLSRWPLRMSSGESSRIIIGPPKSIPVKAPVEFCISRDGQVLAAAQYDGATVLHLSRADEPIHLGPHEDCRYVAITRDGQWVATASHFGSEVKVWNGSSGALSKVLPIDAESWVYFSPDSKWLATTGGIGNRENRSTLWQVGSWKLGHEVDGLICGFSPDGRILVVNSGYGSVRLLDPESGNELAELEHPQGHSSQRYIFTPDGTGLVAISTGELCGFAWDLRELRRELAARGLDWGLPPYPHQKPDLHLSPAQVELIMAEPDSRTPEEIAAAEIARFRQAHDAHPDDARACNDLAWALSTAPAALRSVEEAVELAERAVKLEPERSWYVNTLGVAYYRAGRYRDAKERLAGNLPRQDDSSLAYDLYFLAMTSFQLGETEQARDYLLWANRWAGLQDPEPDFTPAQRAELAAFRGEAESLILP